MGPPVGPYNFSGMLNWTPVLLCAGNYFSGVAHNTATISAVKTIELFYAVEVGKLMSVHDYIFRPGHPRDVVKPKTDVLIGSDGDIYEGDRNYHAVDKRDR